MGSSLFYLRGLYLLGGSLERGAGGGGVTGGLGGGQPDVVVVALGHQQVQQRCAAFLISVGHRLADLLGLGPDAVAVAPPPLYGIDIGEAGYRNVRDRLGLGLFKRQAGLFSRRLDRNSTRLNSSHL